MAGWGLLCASVIATVSGGSHPSAAALADATKVVSLSADGQTRVLATDAASVGDVLRRAAVTLGPGDLVEPAIKTLLPAGQFNINVYRARPVVVIDGARSYHLRSAFTSPRLLAQAAGLTVYPEDAYKITVVTDFIARRAAGEQVEIIRAQPVTLSVDHQTITARTQATTVAAFLKERGVQLGLKDTITPALTTPITSGLSITIVRVADVETTVTETLPHQTQTIADSSQPRGYSEIRQAGSDGHRTVTYLVHYRDGHEVGRDTLNVTGAVAPVTEIKVIGTKLVYANDVINLAETLAAARGWTGDQWDALYNIWDREAHFNPSARNSTSGACGIPQANPCSKMPGWSPSDPTAQINWGLSYIAVRYGDPVHAWAHWQTYRSY